MLFSVLTFSAALFCGSKFPSGSQIPIRPLDPLFALLQGQRDPFYGTRGVDKQPSSSLLSNRRFVLTY